MRHLKPAIKFLVGEILFHVEGERDDVDSRIVILLGDVLKDVERGRYTPCAKLLSRKLGLDMAIPHLADAKTYLPHGLKRVIEFQRREAIAGCSDPDSLNGRVNLGPRCGQGGNRAQREPTKLAAG